MITVKMEQYFNTENSATQELDQKLDLLWQNDPMPINIPIFNTNDHQLSEQPPPANPFGNDISKGVQSDDSYEENNFGTHESMYGNSKL